jgi:glycosyltransferase involved in cell wall biosynthesis
MVPLVTVVTPSLNQGRFIRETIESVLAQDYPRVEYFVLDGGSTDDTISILREYSGRLAWASRPDRGQAAAVNEGWRRGTGEILGWLNSDDVYLPGAISAAVAHFLAHPGTDAVYGEAYHVDEEGNVLARYPTEGFTWNRLKDTCFISQPAAFLRRSAVAGLGYLDETLRFCMDYDLWIRLGRSGHFAHLPQYLALSRLHAATKTLGRRREVYTEVLQMLFGHFGWVGPPWLYAYAKAVAVAEVSPAGPWATVRRLMRGTAVGLDVLRRYGRRTPMTELRRWGQLLGPAARRLGRLHRPPPRSLAL